MSTNTKTNRVQQLAAEQKLIDGTNQFLANLPAIPVGSKTMTPAELVQVCEGRIATGKAAVAAADARTAAVKADRDQRKTTAPCLNAFRRIVIGMFLQSPDTLGVFGLKPPKVGKQTAAEKAATVVKVQATRSARGPIGRKNRAKVKGASTAAGSSKAAPATPAPAAAVTASAPAPKAGS